MNQATELFGSAFSRKRVFVTGHTGFKGSWLCEWLLKLGAEITGYSLVPPTEPALFDQLGLAARVRHLTGDVRDSSMLSRALKDARPDFVFHLAAQPIVREAFKQPVETFDTNLMGTVHVLEALRSIEQPCAAIIVTTDKCYENREWLFGYREEDPLGGYDPYSASKAAAELAISSYRRSFFATHPVKIASARAGNVIGGGDWSPDRIVPDCIRALQKGATISVRNPRSVRPWQHVLEPLSGYLWLAARLYSLPLNSEQTATALPLASAFNFGPAHESCRTVSELVGAMLQQWPGRWEDRSDPRAPHEAGMLQLATDKAFALLGWSPVWPFSMAIQQTVSWYRETVENPKGALEMTSRQIAQYTADAAKAGLPWAAT